MGNPYYGITHKCPIFLMGLWKAILCRFNWHLFDEVWSGEHYLVCDACQLVVIIKNIETEWID